jgi:hypothetical protein
LRQAGTEHKFVAMQQTSDPRQLADLCRRVANIPTSGGHRADRVLQALANQLEQEAAQADRSAVEVPAPTHQTASRQKRS